MLFKRNKKTIHFSGRRHTKTGIAATIIGVAVIAGFLTISMISGLNKGNGSFILGLIGLFLFFVAILGFVLAYKAFKKKDIFYRFPIIGVVLNGLMIIVLFVIYLMGL
ncbi:MAG: hypothetical protein GX757_02005 [Clostridiales bacterium]|nr:hypothetical protein [Clostridiales bacterium]